MEEHLRLQSEGATLDNVLEELELEHPTREVAGWETGFSNLSRVLNGIHPGLHLLVGAPGIGKTAFARQLLDQVALRNCAAGIFFSFAETKRELRIRTLARLSGLDQREIRRGSTYLLHWYGVPRLACGDTADLPPCWEKLKRAAVEAKSWLDLIYLVECTRTMTLTEIEAQIAALRAQIKAEQLIIVIDDCQRLGAANQPLDVRLPIVAEQLQETAVSLNLPLLAVWPNLHVATAGITVEAWREQVASPDVILVMENDSEASKKTTASSQPVELHIVKNRRGEKGKITFEFFPAIAKFSESQ